MPESNTRWPAYARVPPFLPVPLRTRRDGWTDERQANFIGYLAETGCVAEAARRVGMSARAAWRLRNSAGETSLAHAWDVVMALHAGLRHGDDGFPRRNVALPELMEWAIEGPILVLMLRRKFRSARRVPSDPALFRLLRRSYSHARRER
ncbi:hypothetical protein GRI89_16040 [Altererythrobacter salegens]|uniref:LysR family transcriptional regulator n=1 Tax=Croceibacterium salegens TaxID=1737568 RepID=A0A6I4SY80_9SPHN|nr:hypothetical protein [Croceibacterium salegens]MXO61054.1 hypothetical protein [Croceibacterium salegens]